MIITLLQIAKSLNITKQGVAKYVDRGLIVRNQNNKIDLENPDNFAFLESKGADLSVFGLPNFDKVIQKAVETPLKPDKTELNSFESETLSEKPVRNSRNVAQKLDLQVKLQSLKSKQAETELKKIKIEEQRGRLIDKELVEKLIFDVCGGIAQAMIVIPQNVIDDILSIIETNETGKREKVVKLLQDRYLKEYEKTVKSGKLRWEKAVKEHKAKVKDEPDPE